MSSEVITINLQTEAAIMEGSKGISKKSPDEIIGVCTLTVILLIPVKIERNIQLEAKVPAHIEHAGPAGNIIDGCIF